MNTLLEQLKKRRLDLGLKQNDMLLRVGVSRQQYQRLESKGNPRMDTLDLIAKGLNSKLMLIPNEKLDVVLAVLEGEVISEHGSNTTSIAHQNGSTSHSNKNLSDDPWHGLLGDDD